MLSAVWRLGGILQKYREDHGLSLRDLGHLCHLSHTQISNLIKGVDPRTGKRVNITGGAIKKLSEATGIPFEELWGAAGSGERGLPDFREVLRELGHDERDIELLTELEERLRENQGEQS